MSSARDFGLTVVRSSGSEENVICPFHADHTPSATYNKAKGLFYCFTCGFGLNNQQLADRLGIELSDELAEELLEDFDLLSHDAPLELGEKCVTNDYLWSRKISSEVADLYNIHYKDGAVPAMILPVPNLAGKIEGAVYRYIKPIHSRYAKMGRMTPVWPMTMLKTYEAGDHIIVTEGAWSAMRLASAWSVFPDYPVLPVALLGAKANQEILDTLAHLRPIFLYDHDEAGIHACRKMRLLSPLVHAYTLSTAPDDMDDEELEQLARKIMEVTL